MKDLNLPSCYVVSGKFSDHDDLEIKLRRILENKHPLIQLKRLQSQTDEDYKQAAEVAVKICAEFKAILLLACSVELFEQTGAHGLHLKSAAIKELEERPISDDKILSVSCHDIKSMQKAQSLNADIILLSPIKETISHPNLDPLGWEGLREVKEQISCPVYAFGGMKLEDLDDALAVGAQGIAVSSLWK
ncbi:MAG: thiamine phosphate synthase [Gammaproteobacteria bacterium]|nr:thiamine phosphate synthase [Gammaproteobacteria bacterium]